MREPRLLTRKFRPPFQFLSFPGLIGRASLLSSPPLSSQLSACLHGARTLAPCTIGKPQRETRTSSLEPVQSHLFSVDLAIPFFLRTANRSPSHGTALITSCPTSTRFPSAGTSPTRSRA